MAEETIVETPPVEVVQTPPAPAAEVLSDADRLARATPEERKAWQLTGNWPDSVAKTAPVVEASAPEATAEQEAASTKPDKDLSEAARTLRKNRSDERKARIQEDINALTRQKRELEFEVARLSSQWQAPPVSQPSQVAPIAQVSPTPTAEPNFEDFENRIGVDPAIPTYASAINAFQKARDVWLRADWARQVEDQRIAREAQQTHQTYSTRAEAFQKDHSDFTEVVSTLASVPNTPTVAAIGELIQRSEHGPRLAYTLAKTPAEMARLIALSPAHAVYELGKLEARITAPPTVPAPPVTKAFAPPPTLGTRPTEPADPEAAAIAAGDFRRYKAIADREDIARRRAG